MFEHAEPRLIAITGHAERARQFRSLLKEALGLKPDAVIYRERQLPLHDWHLHWQVARELCQQAQVPLIVARTARRRTRVRRHGSAPERRPVARLPAAPRFRCGRRLLPFAGGAAQGADAGLRLRPAVTGAAAAVARQRSPRVGYGGFGANHSAVARLGAAARRRARADARLCLGGYGCAAPAASARLRCQRHRQHQRLLAPAMREGLPPVSETCLRLF